jgi:hypothetical protein
MPKSYLRLWDCVKALINGNIRQSAEQYMAFGSASGHITWI